MKDKLKYFLFKDKNITHSSYESLFKEWQEQIFKIDFLILLAATLTEICFFIFYYKNGLITSSIFEHFYLYLLKPFILNFISFIIALKIYYSKNTSKEMKIFLPIFLMISIFSVIISVHYIFPALYLFWIIPIFTSIIYADKKIEKYTCNLSLIFMSFCFIFIIFNDNLSKPNKFYFNVAVTYISVFFIHIIAKEIIKLENLKDEILNKSLMENYDLNQKLLHDGLTKLYNYTALFASLNNNISNYKNEKLYLAVLDIDFFKKINDTYGHEKGNVILTKLGRILNEYKCENIFPARYGGEEFAIIFKNLEIDEILKILEKIRKDFSNNNDIFIENKKISLSAGVASYKNEMTSKDFFEAADKFLYTAKETGRNKICY